MCPQATITPVVDSPGYGDEIGQFAIETSGLQVDLSLPDRSRLRVLNGIDLQIARGEFVSVVGPSGCGKTTLLRTVAGLVRPSAGVVRTLKHAAKSPFAIGMVPQRPSLLPWLTIEQNVAMPWQMSGVAPPADLEQRIHHVLGAVGLYGFRHAYPPQLSGGMQMRTSIARAFVTNPNVMLMDEAFSGLDEVTRDALTSEMLTLWGVTKCTVLFVTHSLTEAVFLADRVLVLSRRPARIVRDERISLPRPRSVRDREQTSFFDHVNGLRSWVRHE